MCSVYSRLYIMYISQRIVVICHFIELLFVYLKVLFHHHSVVEPATVHKLISQLHRSTGEVVKKRPRYVVNICDVND